MTLVVSVIGSWAVIDALSSRPVSRHGSSTGEVRLTVLPAPSHPEDVSSGRVSLVVGLPGGN